MTRLTLEPLTNATIQMLDLKDEPFFQVTFSFDLRWELPVQEGGLSDRMRVTWTFPVPAEPDAPTYEDIQDRALVLVPGDLRALADQIEAQLAEADRPKPPEGD